MADRLIEGGEKIRSIENAIEIGAESMEVSQPGSCQRKRPTLRLQTHPRNCKPAQEIVDAPKPGARTTTSP